LHNRKVKEDEEVKGDTGIDLFESSQESMKTKKSSIALNTLVSPEGSSP